MRRIQIICDRCGMEISGNSYRFRLQMLDKSGEVEFGPELMPRPMPDVAEKMTKLEYCPKCAALLVDLIGIDKPKSEPEKPKPEKTKPKKEEKPETKEEKPKPWDGIKIPMIKGKPLDIERLVELRNRRWTVLDISNELGVGMTTVQKILRELEKKGAVPNGI